MFTRIIMFMLIAVLALPVTTLTRPAETSYSPWSQSAVAAKGQDAGIQDHHPHDPPTGDADLQQHHPVHHCQRRLC
jgi:hypothetical protein